MKNGKWIAVAALVLAAAAIGWWTGKSGRAPMAVPHASKAGDSESVVNKNKISYYRDPMHPWITSDKPGKSPDCGMDMTPVYEGEAGGKGVRIDPATVQNMGVKTEVVEKRDLETAIRAGGRVQAEENRISVVNARVMGYAQKLRANTTGQKVVRGETLLELYSPDLVSTQEEYLQALRYAEKAGGEAGSRDLAESARRRLLNWGVPESELKALEKSGKARNALPITSPVTGVVLQKNVVEGQNVMSGMELYRIADLSRVWVVANVYQRDLASVKTGAKAEVEFNNRPGKIFAGKVTFVAPMLDEQTKTVEVRVELPNTAALDFKPEMFASVRIHSPARRHVVAIPEEAVIRSGKRNIAVIDVGGGYFEPRDVTLGTAADGYVEVIDGIHEGEKLVISSQFLIDSESSLRAAVQQMQMSTASPDSSGMGMDPMPGKQ